MRKATEKEVGFDLNRAKETFMETKKNFLRLLHQEVSENQLETMKYMTWIPCYWLLLKTYMKLLQDRKEVEELQELIEKYTGEIRTPSKQRAIRKLGKHKKWKGCEMRLTAHIREYEMNQVILDLRSDANVLPKHTWETMGRLVLQ